MIDIMESEEQFEKLNGEWCHLAANRNLRIFQSFEWCWNGWKQVLSKEKRNRLWILRWQSGYEVVIFPFYIDGRGVLRYLMDDHSDTLDCVYFGAFNRHMAFREAVDAILAEPRIKRVWLQKMSGHSEALDFFGVLLPAALIGKDHAFSWLDIPKSDDFIASLVHMKSKDRADIKAIRRKAEKYTLAVKTRDVGDAFPRSLVLQLRTAMTANGSREIDFLSDALIDFAESMYQTGAVDVAVMLDGDAPVALNFLLKKDERYLSWIFLYTDPKASTELYAKYLTEKAKTGPLVFDFGVGAYSYKIGTFRPQVQVTYSLRIGKSHLGHIASAIAMNWRYAKDYIKCQLAARKKK